MNKKEYKVKVGSKDLFFEFSDLVLKANASVIATYGNTKVLLTAVMGGQTKLDYLPLKVDYQERYYAAGEILGGKYNKREGRPTAEATLTARVVDRAIRPFFDKSLRNDVHVVATVLSLGDYDPDFVALNAASVALSVSDIPWDGPVAAVRVAANNDRQIFVNPSYKEREEGNLFDAVFSTRNRKICMIETEASEVENSDMVAASELAISEGEKIESLIKKIKEEIGKDKKEILGGKKTGFVSEIFDTEFKEKIKDDFENLMSEDKFDFYKKEFVKRISGVEVADFSDKFLGNYFEKKIKEIVREKIMDEGVRLDGRALDEVRTLYSNSERISDIVHGTGTFYRGDTHVMSVLTLGGLNDALFLDGMEIQIEKNYIHHYNFPPFSVGETGRMGSPGRREIGHGSLAEKAVRRMIPSKEEFPYTMRIVSEVMSSQGSTSMASACASTLALLSGGVPMKKAVGGIAIGLVDTGSEYKILTDILGYEDFYGDMDFKVAGTRDGITAIQLDLKNKGISVEMIKEILERATAARMTVLDNIEAEISKPAEMSLAVERIKKISIPQDKIGLVIGKGGATIKDITKKSGAKVDIKRDGTVFIFGKGDVLDKAAEMIERIVSRPDKEEFKKK